MAVNDIAAVLASAPPDIPWMHEGTARHIIRALLCLKGQPWACANMKAAVLIEKARRMNGTPEPQGWDLNALTGACAWCGERPAGHVHYREYCSFACGKKALRARARRTHCVGCNSPLIDPGPKQIWCSNACKVSNFGKLKRAQIGPEYERRRWARRKELRTT